MTLRANLRQAAFWHEMVCLECQAISGERARECEECGSPSVVPAQSLLAVLVKVERDNEDAE